MKLVDRFVRQRGESNGQLALRLQSAKQPDSTIPKISLTAMRQTAAAHLRENISKYCHFKTSPVLETLELIAANAKIAPRLRHELILARFIDRCVGDALPVFGEPLVLKLIEFFALCLRHCRKVLKDVRSEIPRDRKRDIWLWLNSMALMRNTPGQQERLYPLMDEYMNELPRKINAELRHTVRSGELCALPRNELELNSGHWQIPAHTPIPKEIEGAPHTATVQAAVELSRKTFAGRRIDIAAANRARWKFRFLGLGTFVVKTEGRPGFCSDEDAKLAEAECKRLFALIFAQLPKSHRARMAVEFLEYLIEPYRPKAPEDRKLAHGLFRVASQLLRQSRLDGAVHQLPVSSPRSRSGARPL